MGIRIHKSMGFLYVSPNPLDLDFLGGLTLSSLKSSVKTKDEELKLLMDYYTVEESMLLTDLVLEVPWDSSPHQYYYIFTPPAYVEKWSRYDDSIDYYESENAEFKIQYLHQKVYPYIEKSIVAATQKEIDEKIEVWCNMDNINLLENATAEFKQQFVDLGLDITKPLKEQIYMQAPLVLQLTAKCLGINSLSLRPVILTYWA